MLEINSCVFPDCAAHSCRARIACSADRIREFVHLGHPLGLASTLRGVRGRVVLAKPSFLPSCGSALCLFLGFRRSGKENIPGRRPRRASEPVRGLDEEAGDFCFGPPEAKPCPNQVGNLIGPF